MIRRDPNAVLVLFAGAADGWGVGLQRCGYRIVALAESDPDRRAVLRKRHPEAVIYDDVRDVTAERLVRDLGYLPGVVVGSPPCQDISSANNGKARGVDGARSGLYFEFIRIVGEVGPDWYAAENSAFVKTRGYDRLHAALGAVGYACWPSVVGAVHAGFFHLRRRSWLAGVHVSHAQEEPLGAARQPRPGPSDAAHPDPDRQQQPQGALGEVGRRPGDGRSGPDADPGGAEPGGRAAHRGRRAGEGGNAQDPADAHEVVARPGRELRKRLTDPAGRGGVADADANQGEQRLEQERGRPAAADAEGQGGAAPRDAAEPRWEEVSEGVGGDLPEELAALEGAARTLGLGGRSELGLHYGVAHGFRARLVAEGLAAGLPRRIAIKRWTDHARACVSAYGDALVPDIAEAFGHAMSALLAELRR